MGSGREAVDVAELRGTQLVAASRLGQAIRGEGGKALVVHEHPIPPRAECWFFGESQPLAAILGVSGSSWRALLDALPFERLRGVACERAPRVHVLLAASTHDLVSEVHIPVRVYGVLSAQSESTVPLVGWKGTLA